MKRPSSLLLLLAGALSAAHLPHNMLYLNARTEALACVAPDTWGPADDCRRLQTVLFLVQGRRAELRVFNRRFFTDYNIQIDAFTSLSPLPVIRGIEEAANLTLGPATLAAPPSKGAINALSARSARDIFTTLLDEGLYSRPAADLESDYQELAREQAQIELNLSAVASTVSRVRGSTAALRPCDALGGNPDMESVSACLQAELVRLSTAPWARPPFNDEDEFRAVNIRAQYFIAVVKALGSVLSQASLSSQATSLDSDLSQFEKNVGIFQANLQSTLDAVDLYNQMKSLQSVRLDLRKGQLRAFLRSQLKGTDTTATVDDAELARLVDEYMRFITASFSLSDSAAVGLRARALALQPVLTPASISHYRTDLHALQLEIQVGVQSRVDAINGLQSRVLERINTIYDQSEVPIAMPKQIDLSKNPGNLIAYFTITRTETFTRYATVGAPAASRAIPDSGSAVGTVNLPPPSKGAAPSDSAAAAAPPAAPPPASGVTVAKGSFEVHQFDQATVVAAFVFSLLHTREFTKAPDPATPANTIVTLADDRRFQPHVLVGLNYYLKPKDTFPGAYHGKHRWIPGILGGVSVTQFNHYFLGAAFEPIIGVNFGLGAHFGTEKALQSPYKVKDPITTDPPIYDRRATQVFFMAGFDLHIFRKIFGKVTGVGQSTPASGAN